MDKWLSANDIAQILEATKRWINNRAKDEHWAYRSYAVRGGKERRYHLADLPEDIQAAYAAGIQTTFEELQRQLNPDLKTEKKVIISRYNGRGTKPEAVKPLRR